MSGIVKLQRAAQAFELIPRALVQHIGVNQDGKFLAIWLACKPPGWDIRTAALRRELGWTRERFSRATRSLQSQGLWRHSRVHRAGGQFEHFYTCLLEPEAGFPAPGSPEAGNPACIEETREEEIREQQQPRAQRAQVVVFSADLHERGLLSKKEQEQVEAALAQCSENAQALADELAGALRARGRVGERGIKNPVLFVKALGQATSLTYAPAELALREARAQVAERANAQEPQQQGTRMPAATRELLERLRSEGRGGRK